MSRFPFLFWDEERFAARGRNFSRSRLFVSRKFKNLRIEVRSLN